MPCKRGTSRDHRASGMRGLSATRMPDIVGECTRTDYPGEPCCGAIKPGWLYLFTNRGLVTWSSGHYINQFLDRSVPRKRQMCALHGSPRRRSRRAHSTRRLRACSRSHGHVRQTPICRTHGRAATKIIEMIAAHKPDMLIAACVQCRPLRHRVRRVCKRAQAEMGYLQYGMYPKPASSSAGRWSTS